MRKELTKKYLEIILREITKYELQVPGANITYDTERDRINVHFPITKKDIEEMWKKMKVEKNEPPL